MIVAEDCAGTADTILHNPLESDPPVSKFIGWVVQVVMGRIKDPHRLTSTIGPGDAGHTLELST